MVNKNGSETNMINGIHFDPFTLNKEHLDLFFLRFIELTVIDFRRENEALLRLSTFFCG